MDGSQESQQWGNHMYLIEKKEAVSSLVDGADGSRPRCNVEQTRRQALLLIFVIYRRNGASTAVTFFQYIDRRIYFEFKSQLLKHQVEAMSFV